MGRGVSDRSPPEPGQHPLGQPSAVKQPHDGDVRGDGAAREEAPDLCSFDIAQRSVDQDDVRHLARRLDDGLETGARDGNAEASRAELLLARVAGGFVGIGDEDEGRAKGAGAYRREADNRVCLRRQFGHKSRLFRHGRGYEQEDCLQRVR